MITPEHETARPAGGPGFADAATFSWGDRDAELYGLARIGLSGGRGNALAVLFAGREPVGATARGDVELPGDADFAALAVADVASVVVAPLREWTVAFEGRYDLRFRALGAPAEIDPAEPVAHVGGMVGYEQLCRVTGTVVAGGKERTIDCLGQRSHLWGEPDWSRIDTTRTVAAWMEGGTAVVLTSVRPGGAGGHDGDATWAVLLDADGSLHVDEPRLSTTYDADGHQRRAGLELWLGEDDPARRAAGEVLCGSSFDLGELRLDCAFFAWHMDGREGVGRYDLVRRA